MCNKMSDVRVNASPPLERVDARLQDRVRPPVRRNLFGTPDPDEVRLVSTATAQEDARSFAERYNFDAVQDRPLPAGNFEWTEDREAPEFYSRPPHRRRGPRVDHSEESTRSQSKDSSKKRPSDDAGLSNQCPRKRSHSGGDDDDEPPRGAGGPAGEVL